MSAWGWLRARDSPDDRAVSCNHEWVRSDIIVPIEFADVVDEWMQVGLKTAIEPPRFHVGQQCKLCGHMRLER